MDDHVIAEIRARVRLEDVIRRFVALKHVGYKSSEYKALCPFHTEKTPSFSMDAAKQLYHCFGCGEGGDLFAFVMRIHACDFLDACRWIAAEFGIQEKQSNDYAAMMAIPPAPPIKKEGTDAEKQKQKADTRARIKAILQECASNIWWPMANNYLASRGLSTMPPLLRSLRVHPSMWHSDANKAFPVFLGIVQIAGGDRGFTGIQRIYLRSDGCGKAPIKKEWRKKGLGTIKGGAVWLYDVYALGDWPWRCYNNPDFPDTVGECWICEGIETGVAIYQFLQRHRDGEAWVVACALGAHNLGNLTIPPGCNKVIIAADNDPSQTGQQQGEKARQIYQKKGYLVDLKIPPVSQTAEKMDWLDMLARGKHASIL